MGVAQALVSAKAEAVAGQVSARPENMRAENYPCSGRATRDPT